MNLFLYMPLGDRPSIQLIPDAKTAVFSLFVETDNVILQVGRLLNQAWSIENEFAWTLILAIDPPKSP